MRDSDIIEKIHNIYDQKEPDVLSRLDFSKVEMKTGPKKSLNKRYVSAAAIYAAACLVIVIVLPFLIGGRGEDPKPSPSNSDVRTETSGDENDAPKSDDTRLPLEVNIADGVPEEYHEVLVRYRSAVEAIVKNNISENDGKLYSPYEPVHYLTAGMCEAGKAMESPETEKYGYSLKDMNGDGTPELLLITENHVLLEIYTVADGEAQMVEYFRPRYTGLVMGAGQLYTNGSGGTGCYNYTLSKLGESGFTVYTEFGSDMSDEGQYYYELRDGEKTPITEEDLSKLVERYPDIPQFSGENNTLPYDIEFYAIIPTAKDIFMEALERGIKEGRIEDLEYNKKTLYEVVPRNNTRETDIRVFSFFDTYRTFAYQDGEAYPIRGLMPAFGTTSGIQTCDIDKNGKDDLLIYGTWGSGVAGYDLSYFDSGTKTVTEIYRGTFATVDVVEEVNADGIVKYSIYHDFYYLGELKYENGKIVTDLIYEGTLSDVVMNLRFGKDVEAVSNDVYPIPAETDKAVKPTPETVAPEKPVPETEKKPSIAEPASSDSKKPNESKTTTTAAPEPEKPVKVYPDPANSARIRFYKDMAMTDEYASAADIPYGAKVYYKKESDPGYIFTNISINVYRYNMDVVYENNVPDFYSYFINNYHGDKLEYSFTAVLGGDSDGNLFYDMNDVDTLRKYLAGDEETLFCFGKYGYSERLDYNCDGYVTEHDLTGLLAEIETGEAQRNTMSKYKYSGEVGFHSHLLKFDDAVVFPHGRLLNSVLTDGSDYTVYSDTSSIGRLSDEIKAKYDDGFFVHNDLVLVYCYTEDGAVPSTDELYELWYTGNMNGGYLNPVYSDDNAGQTLSEYAICIEVSNTKKIQNNNPV